MDFLSCNPFVAVIGGEYEIVLNAFENGIFAVKIGGNVYHEKNSGVLCSEKKYAKIRVPQSALDAAGEYVVSYRKTIERVSYFSRFEDAREKRFSFRAVPKDNVRVYHIADVHQRYETALKTASFFGGALDLFILNGDIGEVETEKDFFDVAKFAGDVTKGEIPVIFARGNHDARGKLAEKFTDYFPHNDMRLYYGFEVGPFAGAVFDCGEDKPDSRTVYAGANVFEPYRREETEYLKTLAPDQSKIVFAVGHICPVQTTQTAGDVFDIERDVYGAWSEEFRRMGVKFMLCGHIHKAYILRPNDERSLLKHDYPVIVGSAFREDGEVCGAALTVNKNGMLVSFTDSERRVLESYKIDFADKSVCGIEKE
ncbi:MAG: hypothetical protein DBX59_02300 [Bacillota bacterium]|nr:MAG: hypothetical protein DBX59_02300 [Bacillota bacterium]